MQRTKKNRKEERRKEGGKEGRKDTSNEHLSNIYNPSDEHQSQKDRTSVGNQSEIYRISIRRKSFENQPDEHYQHLAKITKYTHNWINTTRSAWKPKCSSIVTPQENPQITIASKKVASFRFNQKAEFTERGHPNRSHTTQAMADRCTVYTCFDFFTTGTIGYSTCSHVIFSCPCPTCRATWTRDRQWQIWMLLQFCSWPVACDEERPRWSEGEFGVTDKKDATSSSRSTSNNEHGKSEYEHERSKERTSRQ